MRNTIIDWIARIVIPLLVAGVACATWRWFELMEGHLLHRTVPCLVIVAFVLIVITSSYVEVYWLRPLKRRERDTGGGTT